MSKKSRKEGNRVACLIKKNKAEFYIADVDLGDVPKDVVSAGNNAIRTLGKKKSAFMIISAGIKCLTIFIYVPEELSHRISYNDWMNAATKNLPEGEKEVFDDYITLETTTPFKLIDLVRTNGFAYLNKQGCIEDEESSEEFIGFDDL